MKTFPVVLFAFVLMYHSGCSSTSYQSKEHSFSFVHNGQAYSILSRSLITGRSVNYLLLREGDTFLLSARDDNLDGVLDTLLVGDLPLAEANAVYTHGITQAVTEGKSRQLQPVRVYVRQTTEGFHAIHSYEHPSLNWYNTFVVHNGIEGTEVTFLDRDADGMLDQVEQGIGDLEASQDLYQRALEEGILAGQIVKTKGTFLVNLPL